MILRQPKTPQIALLIFYLVPDTYNFLCGGKYSYSGGGFQLGEQLSHLGVKVPHMLKEIA